MWQLTFNIRTPGTVFLMVGFALAIAILSAMFSIGEAHRVQVVSALNIPPEGEDAFRVIRLRGNERLQVWPISQEEVAQIRRLPTVLGASTMGRMINVPFKHNNRTAFAALRGVDAQWHYVTDSARGRKELLEGREIGAAHVANSAMVCTIDIETKAALGIETIGDKNEKAVIRIEGLEFEVIGITEDYRFANIPVTTFINQFDKKLELYIRTKGGRAEIEGEVNRRLQEIFQTGDEFELTRSWKEFIAQYLDMAQRQAFSMGLAGSPPLLVVFLGALGIAASWLKERAQVYAVLRVFGATRLQVLWTAITEPLIVAAVAAAFGLGLGYLLSLCIENLAGMEVAYNWRWFAVSWAAGFVAMIIPALYISIRAAAVHPAEAVRM